jgi:uncharacterized membrane protein (DUF4010 family)
MGATPLATNEIFLRLGIALALGLLVGLERERSEAPLAGFRTFPLVTLLGSLAALLAPEFGGWLPAAGLVALAATIGVGDLLRQKDGAQDHPGITTEVALLLMYLVGVGLVADLLGPCVVLAGTVAVLLHLKERMHALAHRLSEEDVLVLFRFVLIALVVLPMLPDRVFGPFKVLNPHEIWWMVVLIVGIGLASYVAYRLFGQRAGTLLAGILGGLISSTATTASYARRVRAEPSLAGPAALVVLIASTVVYARVCVLLLAVAPARAGELLPPVLVLLGFFVLLGVWAWTRRDRQPVPVEHAAQAAELRPALVFALIYAAVLFSVAAARHYFAGSTALYGVAALSGLTDVDALTLSSARLVASGQLEPATAWRLVVLATLSNLVFKGLLAFVVGGRALGRRLAWMFGLGLCAGAALLVLWP